MRPGGGSLPPVRRRRVHCAFDLMWSIYQAPGVDQRALESSAGAANSKDVRPALCSTADLLTET